MLTLETLGIAALGFQGLAIAATAAVSRFAERRAARIATPPVAAAAVPPIVQQIAEARANGFRRPAPVKAAEQLLEFMQGQGATGYFTVGEIDQFWAWYSSHHGLDDLHPAIVRGEMAAIPGVYVGLKRLNGPEFREVKRRAGTDRCTLYRVPDAPRIDASQVPETPRQKRQPSGNRPANPKKRVLPGNFSPAPSDSPPGSRPDGADGRTYRTLGDVAADHGRPLKKVA